MTKAVIFDLDGTLYDKKGLARRLIISQIPYMGVGLLSSEREARKILRGKEFPDGEAFYREFFRTIGRGRDIPRVPKWYNDYYMSSMVRILTRHYNAYPWVERTIFTLKTKGIKVALLSDYGKVEEKLFALGLSPDLFDGGLFAAPDLGGLKPCPSPFLKVASSMGVAPGETVFVGDREDTDGDGARAAGMTFIPASGDTPPEIPL